jgi:RPA family protein
MEQPQFKRNVAYKMRIGTILSGKQIIDGERLKMLEINDKQVIRINVVANVVDKYVQEGERSFASITLDDGTGQIKIKVFGEDIKNFDQLNQGDTLMVIGLVRSWKNEVYLTPEIIKKKEPAYLLVRKLEVEAEQPKALPKEQLTALKDKLISMIKEAEPNNGIEVDKLILELHEPPEIINAEIKKLLEEGMIYEPRPGKLRWLG